ncbi:MAG: hypothetical protein JSR24_22815 [Proteobacteria bacterium]|nr:hypothetical protein [Pseudomonadota bacterium]
MQRRPKSFSLVSGSQAMKAWAAVLGTVLLASVTAAAQPAPRVLGTTTIAPPADSMLPYPQPRNRIAVLADGSAGVVLVSRGEEGGKTVELLRFDRAGSLTGRSEIAAGDGDDLNTTGPWVVGEELAVVTPVGAARSEKGVLLRVAADGRAVRREAIHDPHYAPAALREQNYFDFNTVAAARDGTLLVAGSYGPGPGAWWWALYAANGTRLAEGGERDGKGPTVVVAAHADPAGGFALLVEELDPKTWTTALWLHRYDARGMRTAHHRLASGSPSALFDGEAPVVFDGTSEATRILFFDRAGRPTRTIDWRGGLPSKAVLDVRGFTFLVDQGGDQKNGIRSRIVRLDRNGHLLWQSAADFFIDVARGADGTVWALAGGADPARATVRRFADP